MPRPLTRALVPLSLLLAAYPNPATAEPPPAGPSAFSAPSPPPPLPDVPTPTPSVAETAPSDAPTAVDKPAPDKPAAVAPVPNVPVPQKGLPRLHIDAHRFAVRLMRIDRALSDDMGEGILVKTVCRAPCDQLVDGRKRQTFFFGAEGMVPSRGFKLARLDGDIVAHVHGGSLVARQVGFLLGGFGGAAVLGGATMLGVGYAQNGAHLSNEGKVVDGPNSNLTTGGIIVLGVGVAMVTTAIVLVATAKTRITLVHAEDKSALVTFERGAFRF